MAGATGTVATAVGGVLPHMKRSAEISECGKYRWWLHRSWDDALPLVCFVMLNPSTADAEQDDPTIRRCIGYAKAWGFGALSVRNLYPWRATKPSDLKKAMLLNDVMGGDRGRNELRAAMTADLVVCAWGRNASDYAAQRFVALTDPTPLWCLGFTASGQPVHPLMQAANLKPVPYRRCS